MGMSSARLAVALGLFVLAGFHPALAQDPKTEAPGEPPEAPAIRRCRRRRDGPGPESGGPFGGGPFGGGPFAAPLNGGTPVYQNAVYYCSQSVADATCSISV